MAAAREQTQERRVDWIRLEIEGRDVALQMVDRRERQPPRPGDRLGGGDSDQERTDQPGSRRHSDEFDVVERGPRIAQGLLHDRRDELEVATRRHLRHDTAVTGVQISLRRDDVREDPPVRCDHRRGGLVARSLDPEDQAGRGSGSRHMINASSRLSV